MRLKKREEKQTELATTLFNVTKPAIRIKARSETEKTYDELQYNNIVISSQKKMYLPYILQAISKIIAKSKEQLCDLYYLKKHWALLNLQ